MVGAWQEVGGDDLRKKREKVKVILIIFWAILSNCGAMYRS